MHGESSGPVGFLHSVCQTPGSVRMQTIPVPTTRDVVHPPGSLALQGDPADAISPAWNRGRRRGRPRAWWGWRRAGAGLPAPEAV